MSKREILEQIVVEALARQNAFALGGAIEEPDSEEVTEKILTLLGGEREPVVEVTFQGILPPRWEILEGATSIPENVPTKLYAQEVGDE
jgi:hypothetical protein